MFLQPASNVIATTARDYPEWHHGRNNFALWYIEIDNIHLINHLNHLRNLFSDLLYQPNTRQFHISLFICGFLTDGAKFFDDDFEQKQLQQQRFKLKNSALTSFKLKTKQVNSFSSALFVEVEDPSGSLNKIREILIEDANEIAALNYCPHITLGLYHSDTESDVVLKRIEQVENINFSVEINEIIFGTYQANTLQGPLFPKDHIQLGVA